MRYEQARMGILGLLVGDALGVPYEFTPPGGIPPIDQIEYEPPKGFKRAYSVPPGTWSDDGSQALCLLDALLDDSPATLPLKLGYRLLDWRQNGYFAVDQHVFDIGITTNNALNRIASGVPPIEAGMEGERTHSNGSLMRTLPIAFLPLTYEEVIKAAMMQSMVTHREPTPMMCCAVYALWARGVAKGLADAWVFAFDTMHEILPKGGLSAFVEGIRVWPLMKDKELTGSGYALDSLYSAKYAVDHGTDYESTVKLAIQFGNDTDTTAAIAGGIAGLKYQAIPERWLTGLRGQELLEPLLARLEERLSR